MRTIALLLLLSAPAFAQVSTVDTLRLAPSGLNNLSLTWGNDTQTGIGAVHEDAINLVVRGAQTQVWAPWGTSLGGGNQRVVVGPPLSGEWWGAAPAGQIFEVASNNNPTGGATFSYWNSHANQVPVLAFKKSLGGEIGQHVAVPALGALGQIYAAGSDGTDFVISSSIAHFVDGKPRPGILPGGIVFSMMDANGEWKDRLWIRADGTINIGTGTLFVEDGALKYRGAKGTVTTIGPP